ncbi:MAG: hypothetical protein KGL39_15265 [Patescibacteria group bacterium]|nr:hypothetical protein [Patescibacteria group bacterium]
MSSRPDAAIRRVSMLNRCMVAGIASALIDAGDRAKGDALVHAVRCCDEFPECSHVLAWVETREEPDDADAD